MSLCIDDPPRRFAVLVLLLRVLELLTPHALGCASALHGTGFRAAGRHLFKHSLHARRLDCSIFVATAWLYGLLLLLHSTSRQLGSEAAVARAAWIPAAIAILHL